MANQWFARRGEKVFGPFSSEQLKRLADESKITRDTPVRLGKQGDWVPARRVKGLFAAHKPEPKSGELLTSAGTRVHQPSSSAIVQPAAPAPPPVPPTVPAPAAAPAPTAASRVPCPYCGEEIVASAIKCRHCNEFLDGRPAAAPTAPFVAPTPAQPVTVVVQQQQNTTVVAGSRRRWNPLVAMLLSFLVPGLGQLYKGQPVNGLVWFVVVAIGYAAFIVPGLILHLFCIVGAGMGDPYR